MSYQVMIIEGNLGRDPEVRYMPNGNAVASFSVGVTEKWTDKSGQKQELTEWFDVNAYGKLADFCGEYLKKGSGVLVEGRQRTEKWEDKNTKEPRSRKTVRANVVQSTNRQSSGNSGAGSASSNKGAGVGSPAPSAAPQGDFDAFEDDIPF